jgi:hypothetical protein
MTPIAQLIAELERMLDNVVEDVDRKGNSRGFLLGSEQYQFIERTAEAAAEALARQEELLAEAGKVVEPFAEAAGHLHPLHADDATTLDGIECRHWRAASRLSEKLKGE